MVDAPRARTKSQLVRAKYKRRARKGEWRPCRVVTCSERAKSQGFCEGHYYRLRRTGSVQARVPLREVHPRTSEVCSVPRCGRTVTCRGLCSRCYSRWRRNGTTKPKGRWAERTTEERFLAKVSKAAGGCTPWTGQLDADGYGRFQVEGRSVRAHVWAYKHFIGPIPKGKELDHTCHDPKRCKGGPACPHRRCVNPRHLRAVTKQENILRGNGIAAKNAAKTHCVNGHEFTPENTILRKNGTGRLCRQCNLDSQRARREAQRARGERVT